MHKCTFPPDGATQNPETKEYMIAMQYTNINNLTWCMKLCHLTTNDALKKLPSGV